MLNEFNRAFQKFFQIHMIPKSAYHKLDNHTFKTYHDSCIFVHQSIQRYFNALSETNSNKTILRD